MWNRLRGDEASALIAKMCEEGQDCRVEMNYLEKYLKCLRLAVSQVIYK